jgi:hypothetical protein
MKLEEQVRYVQHQAAKLAGVCDGAHADDDMGYNGTDAQFGAILGTTPPENWSAKMFNIALRMLPKYHRQIGEAAATNLKSFKPLEVEKGSIIYRERRKIEEALEVAHDLPPNDELPVEWGKPRNVNTKKGLRSLRKAASTDEMRTLWRHNKQELRDRGIGLSQDSYNGQWVYCWWGEPVEDEMSRFESKTKEQLPDLPKLSADIASKLKSWQIPGAQRLLRGIQHWGGVYEGSDTGIGKTYMALAAVKAMGGTPVVVCPLAIVPGWHRAGHHFGMKVAAINYESIKTGKSELGDANRDSGFAFKWTLDHVKNPVLIFDEVHKCKNPKAQNTEVLLAAERTGMPILMLSATGAQDPLDMFAIGTVLHLFPKTKKAFWTWARQHGVANNGWGMKFMGSHENLQDIHREIFGHGRGNRIRIADVPDFPKCRFEANLADYGNATSEINKAAGELQEALSDLAERRKNDRDPELVLTRILRARQHLELLKAPTWVKLAADEVAEGRSAVIFCAFNETIRVMSDLLGTKCIIWGDQDAKQREANRMAFMRGDEHVILVNINAGGLALDLDDQIGDRPRTSFVPVDFNARMVKQGVGRIWRAETKTPALQKFFYAAGTIEAEMADACQTKLNNISLINDGNIDDVLQVVSRDF